MKILLATDLPFWKRSDGAQQRIAQLVDQFQDWGHETQVFYIGPEKYLEPLPLQIELTAASSSRPPKSLTPKLKWYWDAILNQLGWSSAASPATGPMRLADFEWSWAQQQFLESVVSFEPDVIVIEYIKLAYLVDDLPARCRARTRLVIDTHDILHRRFEQFRERGIPHWIEVSESEELNALKKFDCVLAIQQEEASYFQRRLHELGCDTKVLEIGYAAAKGVSAKEKWIQSNQPTFGYLGSGNAANVDGCQWLLEHVWPEVISQCPKARLVVAGSVCNHLGELSLKPGHHVSLLGYIEQLESFYEKIDFCWNPVRFGTGLKIKNVEAFSFGRPLLTTVNGSAGMEYPDQAGVFFSDQAKELAQKAVEWGSDEKGYANRVQSAVFLATQELSEARVYSELRDELDSYNR